MWVFRASFIYPITQTVIFELVANPVNNRIQRRHWLMVGQRSLNLKHKHR